MENPEGPPFEHLLAVACVAVAAGFSSTDQVFASGPVSVSGTSYTPNFDAITTRSTSSIAGAAPGWSFWRSGASSVQPDYATSGLNTTAVRLNADTVGTGVVTNSSSGGAYPGVSGTLASGTDKSIGFRSSGAYPGTTSAAPGQSLALLFGFTNTTGATITNLDLSWSLGRYWEGTRAQDWQFDTSTDGSNWSVNTVGNESYTGISTSTVDNPPQSIAKSVPVPSLSIANGSSYYLRWSFVTAGSWSNAQGLGIDDLR
jgi:hypothetical protein